MSSHQGMWYSWILFSFVLLGCNSNADHGSSNANLDSLLTEKGDVLLKNHQYGQYYLYIPSELDETTQVLVVVHGSLERGKPATYLAEKFIHRWTDFAEEKNLMVISPAFDRTNYQAYGGYRGLFGRDVGADEFVNALVALYARAVGDQDAKFYLYGHSAGGQFVIRYVVRHPDKILEAVASAPGRYAFPDPNAPWPYGMGRLRRTIGFSNPAKWVRVDIQPDAHDWLEASTLPITVVVGSEDLEEQPKRPGHRGKTRIDLALNWTFDMQRLAQQEGLSSRVEAQIIDGIGHNSAQLTPYCMEVIAQDRQSREK